MTDMVHGAAPAAARVSDTYRWTQLAIGVAAMVMIANYQYGWTFFVPDIQKKFGWDRASIQLAFTLFVLFETWLVPIEGWFVDKYGPRLVVLIGGILCAIGWAINAEATTLNGYYLGMIVAGIGAGGVYGTCVGNALKWFPDKRGLAIGLSGSGGHAGERARQCERGYDGETVESPSHANILHWVRGVDCQNLTTASVSSSGHSSGRK